MLLTDMLRRNRAIHSGVTAMTYENRTITYGEFDERVNRTANLLASLGLSKGDRVAILSRNCPEYVEFYFANGRLGSVSVPLNFRLAPAELEYIINDSEAVALVVSAEYVDTIAEIRDRLPTVRHFFCLEGPKEDWIDYAAAVSAAPASQPHADVHEDDLLYQMYTSGTTGRPKGAMISHRNAVTNVLQVCLQNPMNVADRGLIVAPLYHAAAAIVTLAVIANASTAVILQDFVPDQVLEVFGKEKITHALLVPAMILFLLSMPGVEEADFSSLRMVMYGASPIPAEVLRKAMSVFDCGFFQAFGQTEAVAVLTVLSAADHELAKDPANEALLASCGREVFGTEVRVVGENDEEVAPGELGEIIARGDQVMRGYWNLPEATESTLKNGWLHTGDIGTKDENGYIFIMDRIKDMIVSGGENVYPREIEEVLFTHPEVADATVIGVPSDKWGEDVKAIVVRKPDSSISEEAIIAFCGERLAGYKRPRSVDFVDALPKNPSGKVLKRELREPYWGDKTRKVN
jgi:acyl-CoA synthetase (AMP-forming)/AMP-acid ligase II